MRRLLNTLYITTPEAYVGRDGQNVVVTVDGQEKFRVPVHNLEGIVCMNYVGMSPSLLGLCCERRISVCYLSQTGRFLARVTGGVSGNVLLRRKQYRIADDERGSAALASSFIAGKILNSRSILRRFVRDHSEKPGVHDVSRIAEQLLGYFERLSLCDTTNALRGLEGDAARAYYSVFDNLITNQAKELRFNGRNRRPPRDAVNAMLSFFYSILSYECASALETVGLDPQVGFLHRDRPGRLSLALDLMEELRPYLVDRFVLTLINNGQVRPEDFLKKESGSVLMREEVRKQMLSAWQSRKHEETTHPFLRERIKIGLIPYAQAMLLSRHLRGDIDGYPPFLVR